MYEYSFNCQKEYLESVEPIKHVLIAAARRDELVNMVSTVKYFVPEYLQGSFGLCVAWLASDAPGLLFALPKRGKVRYSCSRALIILYSEIRRSSMLSSSS